MRKLTLLWVVLAAIAAACATDPAPLIEVPGQYETLAAAIREVPDGSTIRLAPGRYDGQVTIERPLSIVASPGTVEVVGVPGGTVISVVGTDGVTLQGLTIVGGERGIVVTESSGVAIIDNVVSDSGYRGIEVVYGSAEVTGNQVRPAPGPYVIGIRVANATSWPDSVVADNVVEHAGGYGITVNFAHAMVEGNQVTGGDLAGIAINEMSLADVLGNTVSDAPRYGILVHDMSHAVVMGNDISGAAEPIKLTYHSTVELDGNTTD